MRKKNSFSFGALLHNNRAVMVFSVLASVVIWFSVTHSVRTPDTVLVTDVPVILNTENVPHLQSLGLDLVGEHSYEVSVEIDCLRYQRRLIKNTDIATSVDLGPVTAPGQYTLTVVAARDPKSDYNFSVVRVMPSELKLTFDRVKTVPLDVTPRVIGAAAPEGLRVDTPVLADSETSVLSVKGPESTVNRIASAYAEAVVNKTLEKTETFTADVVLYDAEGNRIEQENLTLGFTKAQVTVPISMQKKVPVAALFVNVPEAYRDKPIAHSLSIDAVTVSGPPDIVEAMTKVDLEPIDFAKITPSFYRFTQRIDPPSGVRVVDRGVDRVRVTVNAQNLKSKTVNVERFVFKGVPEGKKARAVSQLTGITVVGPAAAINALKPADVYAEIDLTDKPGSGEYEVVAAVKFARKDLWMAESASGKPTVFVKID